MMGKLDDAYRAAERRLDHTNDDEEEELMKEVMSNLVGVC